MAKLNTGSFAMTIAIFSSLAMGPGSAVALADGNLGTGMGSMGTAMMLMGGMGGGGSQYDCVNSGTATDGAMKKQCDTSKSYMTYATVSNIMGQQLGAAAQQTAGQIQLQNAATAQQQNALAVQAQANASLAQTGATTQLGLGAMNAAWGTYLLMRAGKHTDNANQLSDAKASKSLSQIKAYAGGSTLDTGTQENQNGYVTAPGVQGASGGNNYAQNILHQNDFNENHAINTTFASNDPNAVNLMKKRTDEINAKEAAARRLVSNTLSKGANEQDTMASNLKVTGIMTTVMGAAQVANGGMSMMAAAEAAKAAKELAAVPTALPNFAPAQMNVLPPTASVSNSPGALAPGSLPGPAVTPTSGGGLVPTAGTGTLGAPFGSNTPTLANGPTPQAFTPNQAPQDPGMMGGDPGAVGDMGTTQPAKDQPQNNLPTLANNRIPSMYGGGATYTGGIGATVGADKGPDLSGLLAQFLPKKEDETAKKGIMDFGSRSPASEPYSLLGRDVNLFERVSTTIMDNTRRGTVGI